MFEEFPKWLYHRKLKPRIVANAEEQANLGDGWEATPAAFEIDEVEEELNPTDPIARVQAESGKRAAQAKEKKDKKDKKQK